MDIDAKQAILICIPQDVHFSENAVRLSVKSIAGDSDLDVEFLRCPRFGGCNSIKIDPEYPENNWFDTRYPFLVGTSVSRPTGGYISMRIKDSTDDTKLVETISLGMTTSFQSPTMVSV